MEKKDTKDTKDLKCKKCGSGFTYVRIKDGSRVCRNCGNIDPIED